MTILPGMSTLQRIKQRPFENAFGVILLITAALTVLAGGGPIAAHLTFPISMLWSALNLAGGAFVLTGLHWRGSAVMARAIESVGWYIESVTLVAAMAALVYFTGWAVLPGMLDECAFVLAMTFRAWFLHDEKRAERVARAILRDTERKDDVK